MSGCGCSKETPCEDKKSQQENHPSIAEASNSKNCDNTPSCCGEEEEEKSKPVKKSAPKEVKVSESKLQEVAAKKHQEFFGGATIFDEEKEDEVYE